MSKTIEPVVKCFLEGKKKKISNTDTDGENLYLFENRIAWKEKITEEDYALWISTCNWNTRTTRDRLNMLPDVWVRTSKSQLYLYVGNRSERDVNKWIKWDGNAINVTELIYKQSRL
jgi:nicotinic acid mononucleotide adenylyltransferase